MRGCLAWRADEGNSFRNREGYYIKLCIPYVDELEMLSVISHAVVAPSSS